VNQQQYEDRLRALPCIVCFHMSLKGRCQELHHLGDAEERDDTNQVPLCFDHHQGPNGIHGLHRREFHRRYRLSDLQMLAITRRLYMKEYGA
jgi:hypothetical protein